MSAVSAFQVAQLAYADVVTFKRVLAANERDLGYRVNAYRPARRAIRHFHLTQDFEALCKTIADLRLNERERDGHARAHARNNAEVLERYAESFTRPFRPLLRYVPGPFATLKTSFDGMEISGKPHFSVKPPGGHERFVYLLLAKEWTPERKSLFVGLLSEIVSESLGVDPRHVEGWDCRTGRKIIRSGLGQRQRARVEALAAHLRAMRVVSPSAGQHDLAGVATPLEFESSHLKGA